MPAIPDIDWPDRPVLERPVFISYCTRDFRVAYAIYRLIATQADWESIDLGKSIFFDFPLPQLLPPDLRGQIDNWQCLTGEKEGLTPSLFAFPGMPSWMMYMTLPISAANSVIVIWTPNARESDPVLNEMQWFVRAVAVPSSLLIKSWRLVKVALLVGSQAKRNFSRS
jgi:hypothetical protein